MSDEPRHHVDLFRSKLKKWRESVIDPETGKPLTQRGLDLRIGKSKTASYIAQIEAGTVIPPRMAVCKEIANALGVDHAEVWDAAAKARLEYMDEGELLGWHLVEVLRLRRGVRLTRDERAAVEALRALADAAPHLPRVLGSALQALAEPSTVADSETVMAVGRKGTVPATPPVTFYTALHLLSTLPAEVQHRLWVTFARLVRDALFARGGSGGE